MPVTAPDRHAETDQSTGSMPHPSAKPVDPRRYRIDLIGVSALLVAGAGLAGTLILFRAQSTDSTASAALGAPTVSVAPVRDQWYLDPPNALAGQHAALPASAVKDRWYEDAASATAIAPGVSPSDAGSPLHVTNVGVPTESASAYALETGVPAVRDQWYLDQPGQANGSKPSTPVRDQWYQDGRETPAMVPLKPGGVFDVSQPSAAVDASGGISNIAGPPRPQDPAKDRWDRE
jgi:hypothetical protein